MAFSSVLQMYLDWANSLLCEHGIVVNELKEFQDGRMFSLLIHNLTGTQLFPASEDCNDDDVSSLDRVQTILDYLTGLGIKLKVSATGVLNGELKSILDVIWIIILHFTIHAPDAPIQQKTVRNGKKQLVQWCASQLGEQTIDSNKGLVQCFEKNNNLAELIGLFCTYTHTSPETYVNNLTSALIAAEEGLGITKSLLSPADVIRGTVEEHSLTIYLALLRRKVTQLGSEAPEAELSGEKDTLPQGLPEQKTAATSRIPVSTSKLSRPSSKTDEAGVASLSKSSSKTDGGAGDISKSTASRKRHQVTSEEQRDQITTSLGGEPSKVPSGIPVRKTQRLSAVKPVQTSTPVSKPRHKASGQEAATASVTAAGIGSRSGSGSKNGGVKLFSDREPGAKSDGMGERDVEGDRMLEEGLDHLEEGISHLEGGEDHSDGDGPQDRLRDRNAQDVLSTVGTELNVSDIEEDDWKPKNGITDDDKQNSFKNIQETRDDVEESQRGDCHKPGDKMEMHQGNQNEVTESGVKNGLRNVDKAEELSIREDGDGQRVMCEQSQGHAPDHGTIKGGSEPRLRPGTRNKWDSPDGDGSQGGGGVTARGEELSFTLPKGFVGRHGDELDAMLEAIASESKQLRQELNEAKAREDFLTKKLNERYSSQEEEVINRLVGELEMLRRENQRLFQELAVARETGAEDHKRCEKLQAAVERLEMDVERLTAENFRLKFAADTGYEVTGDELMAAMEDGDVGFQSLPSPGRANVSRESLPSPGKPSVSKESFDAVPSPILEAQSSHETKLLAERAETSSIIHLQVQLAKAHAENKMLKAQEQERRSSNSSDLNAQRSKVNDLQAEVSKVSAELVRTRTAGEKLSAENTYLKREIESSKMEMEEVRQKCHELEEVVRKKAAADREWTSEQDQSQSLLTTDASHITSHSDSNIPPSSSSSSNDARGDADSSFIRAKTHTPVKNSGTLKHRVKSGLTLDIHPTENFHCDAGMINTSSNQNEISMQSIDNQEISTNDLPSTGTTIKKKEDIMADVLVHKDGIPQQTLTKSETIETTNKESRGEDTQGKPGSSSEAVVDWKYLAMSPEPDDEDRHITQYVFPSHEIETSCISEVESETESRAGDLYLSGSVTSPVRRLMVGQDRERRPSLGGLIVERAQKSPPSGSLQHLSVSEPETGNHYDTLIDSSHMATSPDYVTADESSIGRRSSADVVENKPSKPLGRVSVNSAEGMTPYYTPMVQRTKLQFSSLTSSLESLKSISRKAREDIESETPAVSSGGQRTYKDRPSVPTLESERRWIQQELGRIRLDQNIPGDTYPDLGMDSYRERNHRQSGTLNTEDTSKFISSRRYVPRWRKFQFRNRRSKTSEALGMYSSTPSDLNQMSDLHHPMPDTRLTMTDGDKGRMKVHGGESTYLRSAHMDLAARQSELRSRIIPARQFSSKQDVSPLRSSSDELSEEYKPLPSELREPRKLAESSPSKRFQVSDQNAMEEGVQSVFLERNAFISVPEGMDSLNSQARKNNSPDRGDLPKKDYKHISSDRTNISHTSTNLSGEHPATLREYRLTSVTTKPSVSPSRVTPSFSPELTMQTMPIREKRTVSPEVLNSHTDNGRPRPTGLSRGESGGSGGIVQSAQDYIGGSSGIVQSTPVDYMDALAEKVIREADSGVNLSTSLDPKNGLSTNLYQHKLLSLDEQTYANSLIEKYMDKMVEKY